MSYKYYCAVQPAGFLRHLYDKKHPITKASCRQVEEYIQVFSYNYNYSTIILLANRLAPQPVVTI